MLVNEPTVLFPHSILDVISKVNGNGPSEQLQTGIYEVGHFGSSDFPRRGYEHYPTLPNEDIDCYGVCDNLDQLLSLIPEVINSERQFIITLVKVKKSQQSKTGGWRWSKWGPYVGTQDSQCEYLYDEPLVNEVFCYHIMEKLL